MNRSVIQKIIIGVAALFITGALSSVSAQGLWKPQLYDGIAAEGKKTIFSERFEDNHNHWEEKNQNFQTLISDQQHVLLVKLNAENSNSFTKLYPVSFDTRKSFELETSVKWVRSSGKIGMCFGAKDNNNYYALWISLDQNFSITQVEQGVEKFLLFNTNSSSIMTGSHNKLTFRQAGNKWYFFINGVNVYECEARAIRGTQIGYNFSNKAMFISPSLDLYELKANDNQSPLISFVKPDTKELISVSESRSYSGDHFMFHSKQRELQISTKVGDAFGVREVRVNNEIVTLQAGLLNYKTVLLKDTTRVLIEATDNNENISQTILDIVYLGKQEPVSAVVASANFTPSASMKGSGLNERGGKNYVFFIGINKYDFWPDLSNPTVDCKLVGKTLAENYQFDFSNMMFLFDEKATRRNILKKLDSLARSLTPDDNLVVYYAGHGYYDELSEIGYWIPSDAEKGDISSYIPNSTVRDMVRFIPSFHTLLIADACFAGSLLVRSGYEPLENKKSRWVITSGDFENVEDGIPGKNSPFAKALSEGLTENKTSAVRADALFQTIKSKMLNNADQHPQGTALRDVGDEGGVFVFKRKK